VVTKADESIVLVAASRKKNRNMTDKMVPHLNHEVMEVIFSYINGKSLARCEEVCKLWKEVVQSLSRVWGGMNLNHA
jgi:hypothetical protein